jgi:hypothetical protein
MYDGSFAQILFSALYVIFPRATPRVQLMFPQGVNFPSPIAILSRIIVP